MSRFSPRVRTLPQQEVRDRDKFIVNFSHGARYQNSAIVNCQNQLNEFYHNLTARKEAEEKEQEARWQEFMASLDERIRRRREGQGQEEEEEQYIYIHFMLY